MAQMQIMDSSGHTSITWDPTDAEAVAGARREFERLRGLGYQAFRASVVHEEGSVITEEPGQRLDSFPGDLDGRIIMVPHRRAG